MRLAITLSVFVLACTTGDDTMTPSPDAATIAQCTAAGDCDDGLFCNGSERCDPSDSMANTFGCIGGTPPCAVGLECVEAEQDCVAMDCDADDDGEDAVACGGTDCDDSDPTRYSGATEVCDPDNVDEDCNPSTPGDRDDDGDGHVDVSCCNTNAAGMLACGQDCDDSSSSTNPLATEVCDEIDNDCDGMIDENVSVMAWPDVDGDRYGDDSATPMVLCALPSGMASRGGDCDDNNILQHAEADDVCDDFDNDCDGIVDETGTSFCSAVNPGAVCLRHADGSRSDCRPSEPCAVGHYDCNGDPADGCETALCNTAEHCGACGTSCGRFGSCQAGNCSAPSAWPALGSVSDGVSSEPLEGVLVRAIGACHRPIGSSETFSDTGGNFLYETQGLYADTRQLRLELDGYLPTLTSTDAPLSVPMFTQEQVDEWATTHDQPWEQDPAKGMVVVEFQEPSLGIPTMQLAFFGGLSGGEPRLLSADATGGSAPGFGRIVIPNVVPGSGEIVVVAPPGCSFDCTRFDGGFRYVDPGGITYLSFSTCAMRCTL